MTALGKRWETKGEKQSLPSTWSNEWVTSTAFVDCEHSWPQLVYTLVSCIREKFSYRGLATPKTERRYMPYKHSVILVPICNCVQSYTQIINIFIIFSNKRQTEIIQWISSRVKLVINELTDYFPRNNFIFHRRFDSVIFQTLRFWFRFQLKSLGMKNFEKKIVVSTLQSLINTFVTLVCTLFFYKCLFCLDNSSHGLICIFASNEQTWNLWMKIINMKRISTTYYIFYENTYKYLLTLVTISFRWFLLFISILYNDKFQSRTILNSHGWTYSIISDQTRIDIFRFRLSLASHLFDS